MYAEDNFDAEFDNMFLNDDDDGANASTPPTPPQNPIPLSTSVSPIETAHPGNPSTPLTPLTPSAPSPPEQLGFRYATNAVHMEIQENAKLPTFNMTVDRSNATSGTPMGRLGESLRKRTGGLGHGAAEMSPSTSRDIDEMLRLSEQDRDLTEIFLGEGPRASAAAAYRNAGALLGSMRMANEDEVATTDAERGAAEGGNDDETPASHDSISTPASLTRTLPEGRGIAHVVSSKSCSQVDSPHICDLYPYSRSIPLPIPSLSASGAASETCDASDANKEEGVTNLDAAPVAAKQQSIAAAVATAATIACAQRSAKAAARAGAAVDQGQTRARLAAIDTVTASESRNRDAVVSYAHAATLSEKFETNSKSPLASTSFTSPKIYPSDSSSAAPTAGDPTSPAATTSSDQTPAPAVSPYTYTPPEYAYHPYQHQQHAALAAAHSSTSGSKTEAANKRSQFGFGNDHAVPSIPQPPPTKNSSISRKKKRRAPSEAGNDDSTGTGSTVNSVLAYERKKQKAKDARIKLNKNIDRLSRAICVAGAQSQQRAKLLRAAALAPKLGPPTPSCPTRTFHRSTIEGMEDLAATANATKKWDRPSFVGVAADLVQGLNSQCESLMREMIDLNCTHRQELARLMSVSAGVTGNGSSSLDPALSGTADTQCVNSNGTYFKPSDSANMSGSSDAFSVPSSKVSTEGGGGHPLDLHSNLTTI